MVVLFLLSFIVFCFSVSAWHIFLCQNRFLYPDCIFALPVFGFPVLFQFLANRLMWSMYIVGWSILFLWFSTFSPPVHFISLWQSDIIEISNKNDDREHPWNRPLQLFISVKLFPSVVNSILQFFKVSSMNFMKLLDIIYILRQYSSTLSSMFVSVFSPSFLDVYSLSISSLGCKAFAGLFCMPFFSQYKP